MSPRETLRNRRPGETIDITDGTGRIVGSGSLGCYPDGRPAEVFLSVGRPGSDARAAAGPLGLFLDQVKR